MLFFDVTPAPSPAPSPVLLPLTSTPGGTTVAGVPDWLISPACCENIGQVANPMLLLVVGTLMLLDIMSGLIKAFATKTVDSTVMRQGLFHKAASLLVITLAVVLDVALDAGFNVAVTPIFEAVAGYIALMEVLSILENAAEANPDLGNIVGRFKGALNGTSFGAEASLDGNESTSVKD